MTEQDHYYQFAVFVNPDDEDPLIGTATINPKYNEIKAMIERLELLEKAGYTEATIRHRRVDIKIRYGEWRP